MARDRRKLNEDKSINRFVLEQIMEALNDIYHVGNKDESYTNLVIKLNEIGKKLYRNES